MPTEITLELGLFPGVSEEEYRPSEGINASVMAEGLRSMAHMRYAMENQSSGTSPAMELGTLVHLLALQPEEFDARYVVKPDWDARTTAGKAIRDAFTATLGERRSIDAETLATARAMVDALRSHRLAGPLMAADGPCEVVARWKDPATGLVCKGRLDKYIPGVLALDLKTTADASPGAFASSYYKYGYHRQLAHYTDGFGIASGKETPFVIVCVENVAPFGVCVYQPDMASLECGRFDNRKILADYAACVKSGKWPSYPDKQVRTICLPEWAAKRYESEMAMSERMER